MNPQRLVGFDPGRDKCGVAIATTDGKILHREILRSSDVESRLQELFDEFYFGSGQPIDFVMGNQTTARQWQKRLLSAFPSLTIHPIDERFSSQEARQRYWAIYPAKGLQRLIPLGMREPPRPIDDIVAQILIERYLQQQGL
ncbi:MAG: Holliday junction resolvase RuvX [Synechococcus sp.]